MEENKHDEELEFIEGLYNEAEEEIKEIYKEQKKNRDNLLKELALIMLTYNVFDGLMSLTKEDKKKEYNRLSNIILNSAKGQGATQARVINDILLGTVNKTFDFYSYNAGLKDVQAIIDKNFKGKHFSDRVWDNEKDTAGHLHKQVNNFLNGKVNVNQIKRDIEKTYNTSAYNAKRLVETEVNRCEDESFRRFCKEVGVKKVRRNEVLDSKTCEECARIDGKVYDLDNAPGVVHPGCRGFNSIADDEVKKSIINKDELSDNADVKKFIKKLLGNSSSESKVNENELMLLKDLPKQDLDNIIRIINNSPTKFQELFLRCSDDIKFLDINNPEDKNYYSSKYKAICFNLKNDRLNIKEKGSYTTFFHELGHLIDRNIGIPSVNSNLSSKFKDAIINDINKFIIKTESSYNIRSEKELCDFISEQLKGRGEYHSISDIFGGVTGNKIVGKFSHSNDYWKNPNALPKETFAHFFEATIRSDEEKLKMFKNILPNAYNIFIKLLKEV